MNIKGFLVATALSALALSACTKAETLSREGDINLAGCKVPAGLTTEQVQAVRCTPVSATPPVEAPVASEAENEVVINEALAPQAAMNGHDEENIGARKIVKGDLNGDGVEDRAVLFVLEGGGGSNAYSTHLAAFISERGRLKFVYSMPVSGYGEEVQGVSYGDGKVKMKKLGQGEGDAMCCPTAEYEVDYLLKDGKWLEIYPEEEGTAQAL